ncbi:MAG: peptidyl-prolyl cis-trans isomerase [Arhodomonas sp.]|nr:peptidyl-prolyl cis-trans isomerase [Arhodomonas sp.]
MANVAYENPGSLGPAASAVELPVETTDWVSRAGTDSGITARDAILEAAFSREVLEQGRNSELVEIGENHAAVVRVAEQRPATVLPFEQVREQVRERLVAERAAERAREVGEGLLDRLAGGAEPAELAAEEEAAEWTERGWVTRDGGDIPREIGEVAFRIEPPGEGEINRRGLGLSNGDYAVILLRGVRDGRLADVPEEEREELRTRLRELDARSAEQALVQALRAEADVTIYDDRL